MDLEVKSRYTDVVRVIRMNLSDTLYSLHKMIQEVVQFDDDHLFEFYVGMGMFKQTYSMSGGFNIHSMMRKSIGSRMVLLREERHNEDT